MTEYVFPILVFVLLGAVSGGILVFADKVFYVKTDETVANLTECLPGLNCGACGFSGCEGYAAAIAAGNAEPNQCKPGGGDVAKKIGEVLGVSVEEAVREVAYVSCLGCGDKKQAKFDYNGVNACYAVSRLYGGSGGCSYGCAGFGDCAAVCENGAISFDNGVAFIDCSLCVSCGKCIEACPLNIIRFKKVTSLVSVTCSSLDTGKEVNKVCSNGCIACRICEKKCPEHAIAVPDGKNLAVIDRDKCTNCGTCVTACPKKCIVG
ncbi:MAG: RnfABCDGE type electron transport complex subunit B [Oscillospiraceae bacterium]|jgi:Na+-translocating ferredoxin:NAD+ oxidoreductase RNF subunit RnfB|nr:RnfABCDGE type electron transport complex subunit B [Oscillospiraceae bacterium]